MHQTNNLHHLRAGHYTHSDTLLLRKWLRLFSWEGALGNVFIILTSGAFLTSLALFFGANDLEIGLLCAIPFLAQLSQLFSSYFINLVGSRKIVTILNFLFGRLLWLAVLPLLFLTVSRRLEIFLLLVIISNVGVMTATPGWLSWIADLVPERLRGRYFGRRNSAIAISTVTATVAGGLILDKFKLLGKDYIGFVVIIVLACLSALISAYFLTRLADPSLQPRHDHYRWSNVMIPLRDSRFRHLLKVFFIWNMAVGIAAVFFAVHMLVNLKMSFFQISLYISATSLAAVFLNRPWGKIIDRFGSKPVLVLCAFGIAIIPLIWFLPRADFLWILAFEAIYSGALWGGFNLAAFNVPIANSPRTSRPAYLAMFSVVTGLGFFAASLMGGALAESLSSFHLQIGRQTIVNYHVLFAISGLLRLLAAVFFVSFHEPGEKRLPIMIQFIGYAALKQLSVGRQIFPFGIRRNNHKLSISRADNDGKK